MKTVFALATASLVAFAGAASAMSNPAAGFEGLVTVEQAAGLDRATELAIKNVIHSDNSRGEKIAVINSLLGN